MSANKRLIYVGGLADEVDEKILQAAFIPFGDILDINMPLDFATQKHRGFAFIEFESAEDAKQAIDNMNDSEIYGRTIRANIAKPIKLKEGSARPVWSEDDWLKRHAGSALVPTESNSENTETSAQEVENKDEENVEENAQENAEEDDDRQSS